VAAGFFRACSLFWEAILKEFMLIRTELRRFWRKVSLSVLVLFCHSVYPAEIVERCLPLTEQTDQQLAAVDAQLGPQPPCGNETHPAYPGLGQPAAITSWNKSDLSRDWKPPACTSWSETGFTRLVTIAARFVHGSDAAGLLRQIGAISELKGMRYWSSTHKHWQTLVEDAYALTDLQSAQPRKDFTTDELGLGKFFYFEQVDNLSGKAIYRMHIVEASATRVVYEVENANTIHYHFLPIFHPGELQSIYFLDRESDHVWRYYSIVRTGRDANRLIAGNESSLINRSVAFYRHLIGIPDTQEPPASR
jgi:hypothetical protein